MLIGHVDEVKKLLRALSDQDIPFIQQAEADCEHDLANPGDPRPFEPMVGFESKYGADAFHKIAVRLARLHQGRGMLLELIRRLKFVLRISKANVAVMNGAIWFVYSRNCNASRWILEQGMGKFGSRIPGKEVVRTALEKIASNHMDIASRNCIESFVDIAQDYHRTAKPPVVHIYEPKKFEVQTCECVARIGTKGIFLWDGTSNTFFKVEKKPRKALMYAWALNVIGIRGLDFMLYDECPNWPCMLSLYERGVKALMGKEWKDYIFRDLTYCAKFSDGITGLAVKGFTTVPTCLNFPDPAPTSEIRAWFKELGMDCDFKAIRPR